MNRLTWRDVICIVIFLLCVLITGWIDNPDDYTLTSETTYIITP